MSWYFLETALSCMFVILFNDSNFIFQQRNKPKEPPKAPKAAPFFLPTIAGLEPKFAIEENKEDSIKVNEICYTPRKLCL